MRFTYRSRTQGARVNSVWSHSPHAASVSAAACMRWGQGRTATPPQAGELFAKLKRSRLTGFPGHHPRTWCWGFSRLTAQPMLLGVVGVESTLGVLSANAVYVN